MNSFASQFNSLSIEQITEAFAKQVVSTAEINVTALIRENLPMWESKLFPVIQPFKVSKNKVVADILIEAGVKPTDMSDSERKIFNESVGVIIRRIKTSKGELTATQKRKMLRASIPKDKLQPISEFSVSTLPPTDGVQPGVTRPAGVVMAPETVKPVQVVQPLSIKPNAPVNSSGAVYDLDEFPFREHAERVKTEWNATKQGNPLEWSPADDELLAVFSQISRERYVELFRLVTCFKSNETSKQDCWGAFQIKCKTMQVDLKKYGYGS